ncbi:MAG: hypothetical protein ACYTGS_16535 [Planctomycetota bacterium]|jgi:hypothetical protein
MTEAIEKAREFAELSSIYDEDAHLFRTYLLAALDYIEALRGACTAVCDN